MAKLFIISGLSGAGKDSVINGLKEGKTEFNWVITTTTRPMRSGELEGNPYHFVSQERFEKMIAGEELVEWAKVYDYYYGLERERLNEALKGDKSVIIRVDHQGAATYKKLYPEAKVVFLIPPPSLEILAERLRRRGQDTEEVIQRRLAEAGKELKTLHQWDFIVVNEEGKLDETVERVKRLILKGAQK